MGRNLSSLFISQSYQFLLQKSGSELQDGLGNTITGSLAITASLATNATSASYALFATTASYATNASQSLTSFSASNASQAALATTASYAVVAGSAISASFSTTAATATSASYALTASYALNATVTVNTSSLLVTASAAQNVVTFTKGDGSTFPVTIATGSAVTVNTGSLMVTGSVSSNTLTFTKGDGSTFNLTVNTGSAAASAFPYTGSALITGSLGVTGSVSISGSLSVSGSIGGNVIGNNTDTFTGSNPVRQIVTLTQAEYNALGSPNVNTFYIISDSVPFATGSFATTGSNVFVGSQIVTGSVTATTGFIGNLTGTASGIASGLNITASNLLVTNNLTVNGTASIAVLNYVTGSATYIGDSFIVVNTDLPAQRYAGLAVFDSGSSPQISASLEWDGLNDYWLLKEETGNTSVILTGPTGSKGSEILPTVNKIQKGLGSNYIGDSSITDTGTLVTINSGTTITGSVNITGSVTMVNGADLITHHVKAPAVNGVEIQNNGAGVVALFGAGGSLGTTFYGQINGTTFVGTASLATSASYAATASYVATPTLQAVTTAGATTNVAVTINNTASADYWMVDTKPFAKLSSSTIIAGRVDGADEDLVIAGRNFNGTTPSIYMTDNLFIYNEVAHEFTGSVGLNSTLTVKGATTLQDDTIISGSLRGAISTLSITSNTASLDCSANNFFTLTLVSGSNTYINPSNINNGQTINLRVTQANPGNGTVSFPSSVKQVSGSAYVPTAGAGPVDIVTFISFDASSLFLSNVKNLV